jgi:hypothetical protein
MLGGILITSISVAVITTSFTEHYQQRVRVHEAGGLLMICVTEMFSGNMMLFSTRAWYDLVWLIRLMLVGQITVGFKHV